MNNLSSLFRFQKNVNDYKMCIIKIFTLNEKTLDFLFLWNEGIISM